MRTLPRPHELLMVASSAAGAWAVASCHCGGLIEKEEFGISARRHERALPSIKRAVVIALSLTDPVHMQAACEPHAPMALPYKFALIIMQHPTIAENSCRRRISGRVSDNQAPRVHSVLQRHLSWNPGGARRPYFKSRRYCKP
mmetsp:Transcript_1629/g.3593  ORF Transcript_1629/g.3593 Transcript_1629/m.3593 type:complete len:143 (-) Transcript_1629:92-520(-)